MNVRISVKMDAREGGNEDVNLIHLANDMVQRRAFVNTVINFGFHKNRRFLAG
jgi:hypothetical protein